MNRFLKNCFPVLIVLLLLTAVPAGCTRGGAPSTTGEVTLVDLANREVSLDGEVERIVSLSPGNTEIVFALGLGERVVGVTDYCNYPSEALAKEKVGGFSDPNVEVILTLKPDLVLAGSMHEEVVAQLEERAIPVLVMEPETVSQVYEAIRLIGTAAGVKEKAETVASGLEQQINGVQEKLAVLTDDEKVTVYYELWYDPPMTVGNRTFIHEVITAAGGKNVFADIEDDYPTVSSEAVAEKNPRVILYPDDHGTAEMVLEQYYARPGWSGIAALKDERIYRVDSDPFNRPGPRMGQAIQKVAALLYPEIFDS